MSAEKRPCGIKLFFGLLCRSRNMKWWPSAVEERSRAGIQDAAPLKLVYKRTR